uniref:hypothetical protein n=1 Tax=Thaumasiovibrio subtropicus TaxID=1891207 RepID=UPI00131DB331|nr:hypothetical protein [Thaumasiovibrio subtropicus]
MLLCGLSSTNIAAAIPGLEPEKAWDFDGYVTAMHTLSEQKQRQRQQDNMIHHRLNVEYRSEVNWRFNLGMRNRLLWGDSFDTPDFAKQFNVDGGYFDLTTNWIEDDNRVLNSQLDRLNITWHQEDWQARAGRFRINWAMATLWNPNDWFNAYSIYDFDYQERAGSDAVMLSKKLGFASGVEGVFSPAKKSELDRYAVRYLGNNRGWDWQVLIGKTGLDHALGAGFAGDVKGAGFRGEISHFSPTRDEWQGVSMTESTVATLEVDYSLGGRRNWVTRTALLYISHPMAVQTQQTTLPLTARTLSFTRWTAYADLGFDLNPLSRVTTSVTYYDDGSYYVGLNGHYSLSENWTSSVVLQHFDGDDDSAFGQTANTSVHFQIKWSY